METSVVGSVQRRKQLFVTGTILLGITLLAVLAMAHHPTGGRTIDTDQAMQRVASLSRSSALVHAALITLMLVTLHCLLEFASLRGFAQPSIRGGAIAYGVGVIVMIGAALVSGFVVTDVATLMPRGTPVDLQIGGQMLILCGILNQACANFGAVAMSVGIGLWSIDLLRDRGPARSAGILGCVVGLVPIVGLATGLVQLDVHGMLTIVLLQAAWNVAIAALLIRAGREVRAPEIPLASR